MSQNAEVPMPPVAAPTAWVCLRVRRSDVVIWVDAMKITRAIRPDPSVPAICFVEGITEAFEMVKVQP